MGEPQTLSTENVMQALKALKDINASDRKHKSIAAQSTYTNTNSIARKNKTSKRCFRSCKSGLDAPNSKYKKAKLKNGKSENDNSMVSSNQHDETKYCITSTPKSIPEVNISSSNGDHKTRKLETLLEENTTNTTRKIKNTLKEKYDDFQNDRG